MEMAATSFTSASGGGDWRSAALARAPQVVTFVLALALAAQLALIVVNLSGRSRQTPPPPQTAAQTTPPLDISGLVNAHLFGNAAVQASGDAAASGAWWRTAPHERGRWWSSSSARKRWC